MVQDNTAAYRRMLVEGVIDRSLRAIRDDPRRGLRKLVDMGADCATGRLQKRFLRMAQDMLENEDSPYYDMVVSAVEAVDHHKIKTFGINFGWNCLTVGAGQIRDYEKAHGHTVPWELTLHIGSGPHDMDAQEYAALLGQAKALGIYTYFLFPDAGGAAVQTALLLAESEPDCDFFLFLPAGSPAEDARLRQLDNVLIAVDSSGAGWREAALSLREAGCLYAVYRRYASRKEAEDIASGLWAERILPFAGMVAICVAGPDCSMADARRVYRYALDARLQQRYPMLIADLYLDSLATDICISDDSCFAGVLPDGGLTEFRDGHEAGTRDSVRTAPLAELLRRFAK